MRIAQVAPLYEATPPKKYGGTERVVSYLTEELVKKGHEVTLFATEDSVTNATLVSCSKTGLRFGTPLTDPLATHFAMMHEVAHRSNQFDIIHFHVDYLHFPFSSSNSYHHITTLHGRLDLPDLIPLYKKYIDIPLVSISHNQRKPLPFVNWLQTVYHGLPNDLYQLNANAGQYLAFIGRISPEKRVDHAIEIAKAVGMKIRIAAKVDKVDEEYFKTNICHLLDHPLVEFLGEIDEIEKKNFLSNAAALLFPIDWPEPFGMVMIEAMASGTPTIAFNRGAVPEIIENGLTGFIVNDIPSAIKAVNNIPLICRKSCRQIFEDRFTVEHMTNNYLDVYSRITAKKRTIATLNNQNTIS
ncbi:glycosyltransferase family 4 protein [Solitalea lacus]|uniref:glycosyltransferase family 4 protein n=1 Tax=Solitalea lacus TaxID=2911172 RepID=UPI001EDC0128|nr:glycosyltransferase family 4 protein [Solitalea lacus]UKJ08534.1 glycosyltransferase family 4 protein [Solitalea lacus]